MEKDFYACVEYSTIKEHKVSKFGCNGASDTTLIYAIPFAVARVVLEESNKFVKVKKVWLEKDGKILKETIF